MMAFDEKVFMELDKDAKSRSVGLQSVSQSGGHSRMDSKRKQNLSQSSSDVGDRVPLRLV